MFIISTLLPFIAFNQQIIDQYFPVLAPPLNSFPDRVKFQSMFIANYSIPALPRFCKA